MPLHHLLSFGSSNRPGRFRQAGTKQTPRNSGLGSLCTDISPRQYIHHPIPAHLGVKGRNEMADTWARIAAESRAHEIDRAYMLETSLSHMRKKTAESKIQTTHEWIASHVKPGRGQIA